MELGEVYIDYTIRENKRADGLYNSYNLVRFKDCGIEIGYLQPMLEGQTAVMGCGILNAEETVNLAYAMKNSGLYSKKEKSFYLYPIKRTPDFMDKNIIPKSYVEKSELIKKLLTEKDTNLIIEDINGFVRFAPNITCKGELDAVLKSEWKYRNIAEREYSLISECFEEVFRHSEFIGRSQIMYKYEGIGCIYWHQNSKLLVSLAESYIEATGFQAAEDIRKIYYEYRNGMGFNKTPEEWGAFPTDNYSFTAYTGGANQPVMTGQVKEDIILRFCELGISIRDGKIVFDCRAVRTEEFLKENTMFKYVDIFGHERSISAEENSLIFTFCQVPIVYKCRGNTQIFVFYQSGKKDILKSDMLTEEVSQNIFKRNGKIEKIIVEF